MSDAPAPRGASTAASWPAMVLTAGLGTRLRPLSAVRAKPALPVAGAPLVGRILGWLAAGGVRHAVLNLHHLPATITAAVGDGAILHQVFERLGMHVWFRYQKYREEFSHQDVLIAVDETPVGVFVEIEGTEEGIMASAAAMGKTTADFILDSYHGLFLKYRDALGFRGFDMVFDEPDREP